MQIGHPVFEIFRAAKGERGELVGADEQGDGVLERLLETEPFEIAETHLRGEPASVGFVAVGEVAKLGEQERVLRAEAGGGVVEVVHGWFLRVVRPRPALPAL